MIMKCFMSICFILINSSLYSQTKIISGREINIEQAPWTTNLRVVNTAGVRLFERSGVIISRNLVLTASHNWPDYEYDHLELHVGGASDGIGQYHTVHRFIHHPNKDITLLELSEPLRFGKNIQAIDYRSCVDESLYTPGTDAIIYGWGRTVPDVPSQSLKLRAIDVQIISREDANIIYGAPVVGANTIVSVGKHTIGLGGKGDSGGPLIVLDSKQNPVLAGIAIYADTRNIVENSGLTVYSKVKPMLEWLDSYRCEIIGHDTVSSLGASFEIVNMPHDALAVEWTHSGLTEVNSTINCLDVLPSETDEETSGYVSAKITTAAGTVTVHKELTIMPRIDVDIHIRYNAVASKYEMVAKTVNMEAVDNNEILKCKNLTDNARIFGFVWTYDRNIAIGQEVVFDINPNPPKTHTISIRKYSCDNTVRLEKSFSIRNANNEFVTVYNEPGTISIEGAYLSLDVDDSERLQMTYTKSIGENSVLVNTSNVTFENPVPQIHESGRYRISLYSRTGHLLYSVNLDSRQTPLHINTSAYYSDIYVLHIHNLDTDKVISRMLIIN
jgi:hypothetical protein